MTMTRISHTPLLAAYCIALCCGCSASSRGDDEDPAANIGVDAFPSELTPSSKSNRITVSLKVKQFDAGMTATLYVDADRTGFDGRALSGNTNVRKRSSRSRSGVAQWSIDAKWPEGIYYLYVVLSRDGKKLAREYANDTIKIVRRAWHAVDLPRALPVYGLTQCSKQPNLMLAYERHLFWR